VLFACQMTAGRSQNVMQRYAQPIRWCGV
jgi:hypothetical protein